jgi:hypothetical protein
LKTGTLETLSHFWLGKLANLNVARTEARGIAPHKPLMLLSVIDLIEAGEFKDAFVHYQARLVSQFRSYWDLVFNRQRNRPDITMPFISVVTAIPFGSVSTKTAIRRNPNSPPAFANSIPISLPVSKTPRFAGKLAES